jgi:hypothetical protein
MHAKAKYIIPAFIVLLLGPLFYFHMPLHITTPDIQFAYAKILRILHGELFSDPVTGYPSFHPPYYYLILAAFARIGFSINFLFFMVAVSNVALLVIFMYQILKRYFDPDIALLSILLIPLWAEFIRTGTMYLPAAYQFSVPIYLAGLWVFLCRNDTRGAIFTGLLWGLAFIISPWYLFVVAFPLLYRLIFKRRVREFIITTVTLLIALIPFYIQIYVVVSHNMYGTTAFSLWHGFPGIKFAATLAHDFLMPADQGWGDRIIWIALVITIIGIWQLCRSNGLRWFIITIAVAEIFTAYNYYSGYADRVHMILCLFLSPYAVKFLLGLPYRKFVTVALIIIVAGYGVYRHYDHVLKRYDVQKLALRFQDRKLAFGVLDHLKKYVKPDDYMIVSDEAYRFNIMPNMLAHALVAWRSGEYFQLKSSVSEQLNKDYNMLMDCDDEACLNYICNKYNMHVALSWGPAEMKAYAVFRLLDRVWIRVYADPYYRIYVRPSTPNSSPRP